MGVPRSREPVYLQMASNAQNSEVIPEMPAPRFFEDGNGLLSHLVHITRPSLFPRAPSSQNVTDETTTPRSIISPPCTTSSCVPDPHIPTSDSALRRFLNCRWNSLLFGPSSPLCFLWRQGSIIINVGHVDGHRVAGVGRKKCGEVSFGDDEALGVISLRQNSGAI